MKQEALVKKLKGWVEASRTVPVARNDTLPHGARLIFVPENTVGAAAPGRFEVWRDAGKMGMPDPKKPGDGMMRRWATECATFEEAGAQAGMILTNRRFVASGHQGQYGARWNMVLSHSVKPAQAELPKGDQS